MKDEKETVSTIARELIREHRKAHYDQIDCWRGEPNGPCQCPACRLERLLDADEQDIPAIMPEHYACGCVWTKGEWTKRCPQHPQTPSQPCQCEIYQTCEKCRPGKVT